MEINSSKQLSDVKLDFEPLLARMGQSFKSEFLSVIDKYFAGQQSVVIVKVLLFFAFNSDDLEDSDEKMELIWDILTFFQGDPDRISLATFSYFIENLFVNFFPFINVTVAQKMADRMIGNTHLFTLTLYYIKIVIYLYYSEIYKHI